MPTNHHCHSLIKPLVAVMHAKLPTQTNHPKINTLAKHQLDYVIVRLATYHIQDVRFTHVLGEPKHVGSS